MSHDLRLLGQISPKLQVKRSERLSRRIFRTFSLLRKTCSKTKQAVVGHAGVNRSKFGLEAHACSMLAFRQGSILVGWDESLTSRVATPFDSLGRESQESEREISGSREATAGKEPIACRLITESSFISSSRPNTEWRCLMTAGVTSCSLTSAAQ